MREVFDMKSVQYGKCQTRKESNRWIFQQSRSMHTSDTRNVWEFGRLRRIAGLFSVEKKENAHFKQLGGKICWLTEAAPTREMPVCSPDFHDCSESWRCHFGKARKVKISSPCWNTFSAVKTRFFPSEIANGLRRHELWRGITSLCRASHPPPNPLKFPFPPPSSVDPMISSLCFSDFSEQWLRPVDKSCLWVELQMQFDLGEVWTDRWLDAGWPCPSRLRLF